MRPSQRLKATVRVHRTGEVERFSCITAARGAYLRACRDAPDSRVTLESGARIVRDRDPYREPRGVFVPAVDPFTTAGAALARALFRAWNRQPDEAR